MQCMYSIELLYLLRWKIPKITLNSVIDLSINYYYKLIKVHKSRRNKHEQLIIQYLLNQII